MSGEALGKQRGFGALTVSAGRLLVVHAAAWLPAWWLLMGAVLAHPASGQTNGALGSSTVVQPIKVTGRVTNALNGTPIPRAAVTLSGRKVLTDSSGRFEFPQFSDTRARVMVTKPGYVQRLDIAEGNSFEAVADLSASLELILYPDAVIDGTVTGSSGLPLARVAVTVFRDTTNELQERSIPVGFSQTDSHGDYRFEEPPGRYRIHVAYNPRATEIGEAMLPVDYPEQAGGPATFAVGPGEERRVDLRTKTNVAYAVNFHADLDNQGGIQIQVSPGEGGGYTMFAQPTRAPGEFHIDLPPGSYQLKGISQGRDGVQEAQAKVTVTDRAVDGLVMHFGPAPVLPVELIVDPAAASGSQTQGSLNASVSAPRINQFNLRLQAITPADPNGQGDAMLNARGQFQATSGVFRLRGQPSGQWYVKSAGYGTTNLLTDRLVLAPGSGGEPIRVIVSNLSGGVTGTVLANGKASAGVVYLIARDASLTPIQTQRTTNGTYSAKLPPGSYTAVAFAQGFTGDLRDPAVVSKLTGTQTVDITAGGAATADLTVQPEVLQP